MTPLHPAQVLVSCEHASNRIPARYKGLGLPAVRLEQHIAWDRGAAIIARIVARRLGAPCHLAHWSRLLIDPNRSLGHPKLVPAVAFGVPVPGNRGISRNELESRLQTSYYPHRDAVIDDVLRITRAAGTCVHLGIHSFAPVMGRVVRRAEVGLLYDPGRKRETAFVRELQSRLQAHGLHVRLNYPYRGTSDGFTTALRKRLSAPRYLGIEIETNQKLLVTPAATRRMGRILAGCVASCLERR